MKKILLALCLFSNIGQNNLFSQESEGSTEPKHRYFGIGFETSIFKSVDFSLSTFAPHNKISINIDPMKYLRLDFQFGATNYIHEESWTDYSGPSPVTRTETLNDKYSDISFGVFGLYPFKDGFQVYGGFRYGKGDYTFENLYYSAIETNTSTIKVFSPVFGAEYKFGNRFSVAGEFKFSKFTEELDYNSNPSTPEINTFKVTETALVFRFYPF